MLKQNGAKIIKPQQYIELKFVTNINELNEMLHAAANTCDALVSQLQAISNFQIKTAPELSFKRERPGCVFDE